MRGSLHKIVFLLLLFPVLSAEAQRRYEVPQDWDAPEYKWAGGGRMGNPLGISLKRYTWNQRAYEVIAGIPLFWFYNNEELFRYRFIDKEYRYHRHRAPISLQARLLQHKNFSKDNEHLTFYYGAGVQARRVEFEYYDTFMDRPGEKTYLGIGPEFIVGIEYTPKNIPINVYADINLYTEIVDRPFTFEPQFAAGFRYTWGYWYKRNSNAK
ncbi:hypothetical protein RCC89_04830 [Cytophagaceae bacterium ABcell3]|nr:hypothetical protein RCC89_04830 [Cytophagaceae bacterium ABcell3]